MVAGALVSIDTKDRTPIYAQLDRGLRAAIATGRVAAGEQLPTVRQLAVDLRINANTVAKVYSELERAGVLESRRGVGTFVRVTDVPAISTRDHARQLAVLTDRFLAEASSLGFTADDVLEHLKNR